MRSSESSATGVSPRPTRLPGRLADTMHGRGTEVDAMYRVHIWLRKSDGMTAEEFGRYWLETHAAIARDGYANLRFFFLMLGRRPGCKLFLSSGCSASSRIPSR